MFFIPRADQNRMQPAYALLGLFFGAGSLFHAHHADTPHRIGEASAASAYRVNSEKRTGISSLACGDIVESRNSALDLNIGSVAIILLHLSRVRVCQDAATLESGAIEFDLIWSFHLQAGTFQFWPATPSATGKMTHTNDRRVESSLVEGSLNAKDLKGRYIARVSKGRGLSLEDSERSAEAATRYIGCIEEREKRFYVRDENSGTSLEVRGVDIKENLQRRTLIEGAITKEQTEDGSTPYLRATSISVLEETCSCGEK